MVWYAYFVSIRGHLHAFAETRPAIGYMHIDVWLAFGMLRAVDRQESPWLNAKYASNADSDCEIDGSIPNGEGQRAAYALLVGSYSTHLSINPSGSRSSITLLFVTKDSVTREKRKTKHEGLFFLF